MYQFRGVSIGGSMHFNCQQDWSLTRDVLLRDAKEKKRRKEKTETRNHRTIPGADNSTKRWRTRRWGTRDTRCGINSGLKSSGIQSHCCCTIVVDVHSRRPLTSSSWSHLVLSASRIRSISTRWVISRGHILRVASLSSPLVGAFDSSFRLSWS